MLWGEDALSTPRDSRISYSSWSPLSHCNIAPACIRTVLYIGIPRLVTVSQGSRFNGSCILLPKHLLYNPRNR